MSTKQNIYTDLDSLFDTELALLSIIDDRLVKEYCTNEYSIPNAYLYLNHKDFEAMFKLRDRRVFERANASAVDDVIRHFTSEFNMKILDGTLVDTELDLTINIYPYKLTDSEKKEIRDFYSKHILYISNVHIVDIKDLDSSTVNQYNIMIVRHGLEWFYKMKTENPKFSSPGTRLLVPTRISNISKLEAMDADVDKLLEYVSTTTVGDMGIEFIDNETFMIKLPEQTK